MPAGAAFADGDVVEVQLSVSGNTATQITVEHLQEAEFEPVQGQEFSFEGVLSGYGSTSTFNVGTQQVQLAANTTILGGVLTDLVNGLKVEAEGHNVTSGVLTAEKITIKESIRIQANAEGSDAANVLSWVSPSRLRPWSN